MRKYSVEEAIDMGASVTGAILNSTGMLIAGKWRRWIYLILAPVPCHVSRCGCYRAFSYRSLS
jgi:hypothetical protein